MSAQHVVNSIAGNLQRKGYAQIAAPDPVAFAMFKQAQGLGRPKLVGVIANTDTPAVSFRRAEAWFKQTMGRSGEGVLLLLVSGAPQNYVSEALKQGHGTLGYGQVVCGVYDTATNSYYLPQGAFNTIHLGWDQELFA
jgi:hypothetical protein